MRKVGYICLACGRAQDTLNGDAEIGKAEDKDEDPKYKVKHMVQYITAPCGGIISP